MAHDEDNDAFDALFAEIVSDGDKAKVAEVSDEPEVVATLADSREAAIESLVAEPVVKEVAKPDQRVVYKTVDKVEIEGGPMPTKVYPLGYITLTSGGWRFANKFCLYRKDFRDFVDFIRDSAKSDPWLAALDAAGFRDRGEARKEG